MNIKGMDKVKILAALYNGSRPIGLGFLHADSDCMTEEEAKKIIDSGETYFDYLKGRVMKIDLSGNDLQTFLYNRDNGEGAAEKIIEEAIHGLSQN